jgi:hypothetical protein
MPLVLVKAVSVTHADPVKDLRGCYKRGDVVLVYEDWRHGHCGGGHAGTHPTTPAAQRESADCRTLGAWTSDAADLAENPISDPFYLVRVTGTTVAELTPYLAEQVSGQTRITRRLYRVRVDDMPGNIRNQLNETHYVTVPFSTVQNYLRNKVTGQDG